MYSFVILVQLIAVISVFAPTNRTRKTRKRLGKRPLKTDGYEHWNTDKRIEAVYFYLNSKHASKKGTARSFELPRGTLQRLLIDLPPHLRFKGTTRFQLTAHFN